MKIKDIYSAEHIHKEDITNDLLTTRKSPDTDDPVESLVYNPVAIRLTRLFIMAGWPANTVTLLSLVFGVCGGIFLYPRNTGINLLGIVFEILAAILDCSDGQVARLTHTDSQLGRVLDGTVDIINFLVIYISLGLRMTGETIPFTNVRCSYWVWIIVFAAMLAHADQARMADFYRGMHLCFFKGVNTSNLARSKKLREEMKDLPEGSPLYEKLYRTIYLIYTEAQEKKSPDSQRLLDEVEKSGRCPSEALSSAYVSQSREYIQLTNVLTFNVRAYTLFVLLLLNLHFFYFPFVIIVMEGIKHYMIAKYEKIADMVLAEFFSEDRDVKAMMGLAERN